MLNSVQKRISSFQLGIKLTDAYSLVGIDETEGVASNLSYDLTLSEYSSHRDLQNVYVVTGQLSDDCDTEYGYSNEVEYIGGCSDGHQTLFRLELASDSQEDAVWGRDVLDAAFESVSMEVLHRVVLAFNKYDPPGMFAGAWENGIRQRLYMVTLSIIQALKDCVLESPTRLVILT